MASLVEMKGCRTYGSCVELTYEQLSLLDSFEGGYDKHIVNVVADGAPVQAMVYIANNPAWRVAPSESYLTAIHVHLREHWKMEGDTITVRRALRGRAEVGLVLLIIRWIRFYVTQRVPMTRIRSVQFLMDVAQSYAQS